jgi:ABC-type multidrug transport system ATPase subunit
MPRWRSWANRGYPHDRVGQGDGSALVRILATLLAPDAGRAEVFGHDVVREPAAVRELIGLTGQFAAVDELLTGRENLEMFGGISTC